MAHTNGERRPDEILADIERTRIDMDATLKSIEERLTPGELVDQGIDYLRGSGAPEFVQNLGGSVKANPLPVALVGIGLAWLMAAGRRPGEVSYSSSTGPSLGERAKGMMGRVSEKMGSARDQATGSMQSARERASHLTQSARDSASSLTQSARESASSLTHGARDRASQFTQGARERASNLSQSAQHRYEQARGGVEYLVREQPLALGAIGLAIGALLAAAAPRTREEDRIMGEARDKLADRAAEAGKEQLHKAEQVASSAAGAAKEAGTREVKGQQQTETTRATETKTPARSGTPSSTPGGYRP